MKVMVINGPNLNLLGIREPAIYGHQTLADLEQQLVQVASRAGVELTFVQSNHEGVLIDWIQHAFFEGYTGVLLNAGAYTHYSYALRDAIASVPTPVIEVHLSDIASREPFRQQSVIAPVVAASFAGEHFASYEAALNYLIESERTK